MRLDRFNPTTIVGGLGLAACLAVSSVAGEPPIPAYERDRPTGFGVTQNGGADPCMFFRGQAFDKKLTDFAREMLWACEAIGRRRAAGMPLGDRLEATAAMLHTYRQAVIAAGNDAFARRSRAGHAPWALGLSDEEKYAIADATGALLALAAIRLGF